MSSCLRCALESSLLRNLGTGGTADAAGVDLVVESLEGVGASVGANGAADGGGDDDEGVVERSCHSSV